MQPRLNLEYKRTTEYDEHYVSDHIHWQHGKVGVETMLKNG